RAGLRVSYSGIAQAMAEPETSLRLFGKPNARTNRRMGVVLSNAETTDLARERAKRAASKIQMSVED
ncbi:MAG: phosphoribosylglycinamide formyltransferase 2, partial [Verrucomicrobiae bacterium]|nr:phosphoribosylglycinamide formyltransferase 2 [Verrucomicrobiae bacterium]